MWEKKKQANCPDFSRIQLVNPINSFKVLQYGFWYLPIFNILRILEFEKIMDKILNYHESSLSSKQLIYSRTSLIGHNRVLRKKFEILRILKTIAVGSNCTS